MSKRLLEDTVCLAAIAYQSAQAAGQPALAKDQGFTLLNALSSLAFGIAGG